MRFPCMNIIHLPALLSLLIAGGLSAGCVDSGQRDGKDNAERTASPVDSEKASFYVDTLYTGLENPWGMTWLPDGRLLVTERAGEILVFKNDQYTGKKLKDVPATYQNGQGGLLDIQLHPDYADNGWIYVTYAKPENGGGRTVLARFQLNSDQITNLEVLYRTDPVTSSGAHFGSRIIFDAHGYVYFSTGERGTGENAQNLTNDMGKIHRLHDDGRIPQDNPFASHPNAKHSIWSYGHRNVQGLVYDGVNDVIYATEHGPRGGDELNVVEKGRNYGWPVITYGINYDGSIISDLTQKSGMEQPIHYWVPSIGPCGLLFYTGDRYPGWKHNLFVGALAGMHVVRIEVSNNNEYRHGEKLLPDIGRVRQVAQSPDGYIYLLTEGPGLLLKLIPAKR